MVVLVFITNCQVSLKPKSGPDIDQIIMAATAKINVSGLPAACAVAFENFVKNDVFFFSTLTYYLVPEKLIFYIIEYKSSGRP